jgi:hypothetical protein
MYCYESPTPRFAQRGFPSEIATPIECVCINFLETKISWARLEINGD